MNPYHFYVLVAILSVVHPWEWYVRVFPLDERKEGGEQSSLATAVLQAMVAGTFLYVASVEVTMKELMSCQQLVGSTTGMDDHNCKKNRERRQRLIAFLFGYLVMSALVLFV